MRVTRARQSEAGGKGGTGRSLPACALLCLGLLTFGLPGVWRGGAVAWAQSAATPSAGPPKPATQVPLSQGTSASSDPGQKQPSAERVQAPPDSSPAAQAVEDETQSRIAHPGVLLDRVVAVVNGDVILESDLEEERRLSAFQPITDPTQEVSRQRALARLIDRTLLLQQSKLQPQKPVTDADVQARIAELRKAIPACKQYRCETEEGWQRFLKDRGVTMDELQTYWRDRLITLQFIELRFRTGIRISPAQIREYYDKTMLPEYARQHVTPPKLEAISDRIQGVLLEQQVSGLLADWLKSLRAQGTVQVMADGVLPT